MHPRSRRTFLPLITRTKLRGAVRSLHKARQLNHTKLPDPHTRVQLDWQRGHVEQLQRDEPFKPRVDEPGCGMRQQTKTTQRALTFQPCCQPGAQTHTLQGGSQNELAGVQDEHPAWINLDEPGQVFLLLCRVDVGVLVVVHHPEGRSQSHVHRRWLDQGGVVGVNAEVGQVVVRCQLSLQITVTQVHYSVSSL